MQMYYEAILMSTLNMGLFIADWKSPFNYSHLPPDLAPCITLNGTNYQNLEQIYMVPKMFEPLKFDCILFQWRWL